MRRGSRSCLLLLLVGLLAFVRSDDDLVRSTIQEDQDERDSEGDETTAEAPIVARTKKSVHILTDIPPPGDFADVSAHLVSHDDLKWRAGDEVTLLCHFSHRLAKNVQVTGLAGSLNNPIHFGYYMQNFTEDREHYSAVAKEDVTFDYTFKLKPTLDPGQWRVAATIYYEVGPLLFASTFFNETVTLTAPASAFSLGFLFLLFAGFGGALYAFGKDSPLVSSLFGASGLSASGAASEDESAAKARADQLAAEQRAKDDDSWTADARAFQAGGAKQKKSKPKASKRK